MTPSELLDLAWSYPLFEALYGRRSRRFGLGFEMPEGPFRYKSAHAPVPLSEIEEALLVGAGAGFSGLAHWDLPTLAEQLCISRITLGELHYGAEKSARRVDNLTAIQHFAARLDVLAFEAKAAAHYGQVRAELERTGAPCGPHDMQIGGHARSEGMIVVTNNMCEFSRMPGIRAENWV